MVKEIPLTKGYVAIVDDEDFELVSQFSWHASVKRNANGSIRVYARRSIYCPEIKRGKTQRMHRFLLNCEGDIDHKDGNGLNNTRSNLRPATRTMNNANAKVMRVGGSQYRGVWWSKDRKGWRACIRVDRKIIHLGTYQKEIDAALAYDVAARNYFGEFANPNFAEEEMVA